MTPSKSIFACTFIMFIIASILLMNCQKETIKEKPVIPNAFEQNNRLGGGANVGSILYRWDNWDEEREKEELDLLKGLGMKNVRINLRPFLHASEGPSYTLSSEFFERLDWLINESLIRGFTVIIDEHQYRVMGQDPMALKDIYMATWKQIAEHYKDYPDNVYFELLNEPNNNLTPYLWNYFLKEAYDIIRASNPARTLVIGPGNWNKINELENLILPEEDRNIIVAIHFYNPHKFTHQGKDGRSTGISWPEMPEETQDLIDEFQLAADWGKENNRPLFLDEFGVHQMADPESAARWIRSAREQIERHNMPWSMWKFMSTEWGIYNENEKTWIDTRKKALMLED
ncbi:glycoside hydrolase family 5 protein [Bacteroidota bacterium]